MDRLGFIVIRYAIIFGIGLIEAKHKLKKIANKKQDDKKKEDENK